MKNRANLFLLFLLINWPCTQSHGKNLLKLWYDCPAESWEEALPIGNGRLGAMIYGTTSVEHIQLNEGSIWAGEPGNNIPVGFRDILPEIRSLIFKGMYKEAQELTKTVLPRNVLENSNYGMPYQTVGDLWIDFPDQGKVENYYRDLDISNAISTVRYKANGVTYKREYFATAVDQVIAIRLTADKKRKISFILRVGSPHKFKAIAVEGDTLILTGSGESVANKKGKVRFDACFLPIIDSGQIERKDSALQIKNANSATIYISIGTNFKNYKNIGGNSREMAGKYLRNAITKPYDLIKQAHIIHYRHYFDRVKLDLGITDYVWKTTDQRIAGFKSGNDPQLVSLYFQFGRYLLISCSQPGNQAANLQGIWNDQLFPPWDSKYTVNINIEMIYWPAEVTNLPEMAGPLFSMIKDLSETGQEAAEEMYGARGWMMHHNTDIWRFSGPIDGAYYEPWPMGGAWLSQHLWQHYLYSGDTEFLDSAYSILKGIATYYVDVLQPEPSHQWLVVCPCMSPENAHHKGVTMAAGNTMDNQLVFDVFSNLMAASRILGKDVAFADTVRMKRDCLPPMQIGQFGQLQEWLQDWDRTDDHHRHVSHLYGMFPSNQISPFTHPELFEAAKNALIYREDKSTGWSMGWKVNLWARLLDGNHAFKLIKDQLTPVSEAVNEQSGGTYPNLFDAHPPFQIDGNMGCTSGIAEMLLQCQDRSIYLLPALPDAWPAGKVSGLRARGGFVVDMIWNKRKLTRLTIHSSIGGNCRLRLSGELKGQVKLKTVTEEVDNPNPFYQKAQIKDPLIKEGIELENLNLPLTKLFEFETKKGGYIIFQHISFWWKILSL